MLQVSPDSFGLFFEDLEDLILGCHDVTCYNMAMSRSRVRDSLLLALLGALLLGLVSLHIRLVKTEGLMRVTDTEHWDADQRMRDRITILEAR